MSNTYQHGEFEKPTVTRIIADCNDKSQALLPWATRMMSDWIRLNTEYSRTEDNEYWIVTNNDLINAQKNYRDVSQDALDIGSEVHSAIETWLKYGKEPINPRDEVLAGFVAFLEFYDEHKMKPIELEFTVYGDYWAGTLDYFGWFNGQRYVIDFKTSKAHYIHEHGPQIAAYKSALPTKYWMSISEGDPLSDVGTGVLRLDKTSGFPDFKDYTKRYEKDLREFQLMVPLYLHRHPRIAKKAGYEPIF